MMLKLINQLFSLLPFNGKKTPISFLSLFLAYYIPDVDPVAVDALGPKLISAWQAVSEAFVVLSVLHSQIKNREKK